MKLHHIKEITLIICESCFDFIVEENSQELRGKSYCVHCISESH
jgi:formylmethanofuran dehydrogenase subunit E